MTTTYTITWTREAPRFWTTRTADGIEAAVHGDTEPTGHVFIDVEGLGFSYDGCWDDFSGAVAKAEDVIDRIREKAEARS